MTKKVSRVKCLRCFLRNAWQKFVKGIQCCLDAIARGFWTCINFVYCTCYIQLRIKLSQVYRKIAGLRAVTFVSTKLTNGQTKIKQWFAAQTELCRKTLNLCLMSWYNSRINKLSLKVYYPTKPRRFRHFPIFVFQYFTWKN